MLPADQQLNALLRHDPLSLLVATCIVVVLTAVAVNFLLAAGGRPGAVRRSPVATATMIGFFVAEWWLIHAHIGRMPLPGLGGAANLLALLGAALVLLGTIVNIAGRVQLRENWADQATVYADQQLVTGGVYRLVRHPLYASLIWMGIGAALVYGNAAALAAVLLVFVPMMRYRAHLEEVALLARFPAYAGYQARVGRLIPRFMRDARR
jgi:protein-S-isoprenylcysteine O-methyltransferase Ste14